MTLAPSFDRAPWRTTASAGLVLACALLSGPVQAKTKAAKAAPRPPAAAASTPSALPEHSALEAAASRYRGQFIAPCQLIAEGLYTQDLIDLLPQGTQVNALYHKGMFTDPKCQKSNLLVILHLPPVSWEFNGTALVEGSQADTVTVTLRSGLIMASVINESAIRQDMDQIVIKVGTEELPIRRQAEGSIDKDIRLLKQDSLHFGDPEQTDANGFPKALLQPPFTHNPTPPSP
jgi:hypothetical protein